MILSSRFALASDNIVSESFDGEFVVVDLTFGKYFSFSDSGNVIWQAVSSGLSAAELLGVDQSKNPLLAVSEVEAFVLRLLEAGLIVERADTEGAADGLADSLREQLQNAAEKPDIQVFDDLADLFLADPIHDVEEPAGWPVVRPT
ncbi:PqqD family protein [Pseudohoeflea coraliihabitans]|uniref:PqqD family protein n=1 Tax=Pseudohoeflea coraliihabitans TaxID=2860393 RepID=A0ABS6WLI2_9HYPH|nr:PqqD family protein [Pseudohoeflea sp. DP4N28-3]MBW3096819.1 PqqD family protein [Pseudohoeflea sp. DP4N28-3]